MTTSKSAAPLDPRITNELLEEIDDLYKDSQKTEGGFSLVVDEYVDSTRWFEIHSRVFTDGAGNFWKYLREVPATEYQEDSVEPTTVDAVTRVQPKQITVTTYVPFEDVTAS